MRGFRARKSAGKMRKNEEEKQRFLVVAGGGRERVLSQACLIWRKRVLAIGPSPSLVSLPSDFSSTPHAQQRRSLFNHLETVTSHGQGSLSSPYSPHPTR